MDFSIWLLMGAALVFFMNTGFAMVESGFVRAKNTANIVMKNLTDFCLGTIGFVLIGFSLMFAEDYVFGIIGIPNLNIFSDFANFDFSNFVFNLVFCATAATIVSGAMAERTKFSAYCIYSLVISAVIYPIQAGWIWNGNGWLAQLGFVDFAGSTAIHMVGGISACIGAILVGPRHGKYVIDKQTGKKKARAIPGHAMTLGALGCFVLWFGWYGFNGAAATNTAQMGTIFLNTTVAPAVAAAVTMAFTWIKNKKPDVSMSLNGALAGLVAITAGCSYVDAASAAIIGAVAGILLVLAVEIIDMKLCIDDPVGAIAVHGVNGIWGTLAVGLFARPMTTAGGDIISDAHGLFYGGGFRLLGVQTLGIVAVAAWTILTVGGLFLLVKKTHGLRVSLPDEMMGLDIAEHGIASSYPDFAVSGGDISAFTTLPAAVGDSVSMSTPNSKVSKEQAVPVVNAASGTKITKVTILTKKMMFEPLKEAFDKLGITGLTVSNVMGYGMQRGNLKYRGVPVESQLLPKIQIDVVVAKIPARTLIDVVKDVLYTGNIGDGKIFVYDVENVVKVRTGEEGYAALQDAAVGE